MKQKTSASSNLDSKTFGTRAKELISISVFTVLAALVSTLLMDLIVFPLTMFAVSNIPLYNTIIKIVITAVAGTALAYWIFSTSKYLKNNGKDIKHIILFLLKRPFHYIGLFLFVMALSGILIAVIYLLFSLNYYYLHRLAGGA